jgi:hypothetical protein
LVDAEADTSVFEANRRVRMHASQRVTERRSSGTGPADCRYDAAFYGIPLPDTVRATIQDRAYTSPIWYTPKE